jgi:hypothetical protein
MSDIEEFAFSERVIDESARADKIDVNIHKILHFRNE